MFSPAAGFYFAVVHGWQTDGPDANYDLFSWSVGADEGNMTVTAPGAAVLGSDSIMVDWAGLNPGTIYLGEVSHHDGDGRLGQTVISISTE